ncbi:MAG: cysteine desulfurase/selenocysteine lyase [Sphingobacteriales bacterium]|jgi:cysteine desulfurase/selenocysteine lyase
MIETKKEMFFDVNSVRADFPILNQKVGKYDLVYLDNAATSQKPNVVIDSVTDYYQHINSNIHRGVHYLSQLATDSHENARDTVRDFIGAEHSHECIFVRNATEGINLVASSWGRKNIHEGDEIIISEMEHHANIVPWQIICEERKAVLKVIPMNDDGELIFSEYEKLLSSKTKLVSIVYISNTLGTINPVKDIIELAHKVGALVMIDGAQSSPHMRVNVQELDCDFYVFSGHKVFGPSGTGILYGKEAILNDTPPYQTGGAMISEVTFPKTTFNELPFKFEAGTPNIEGAHGLAKAIDYLNAIGFKNIEAYEKDLLEFATAELLKVKGLKIIGTAKNKASVISFLIDGIHSHDIGVLLDKMGIAVRTGHHCCQPIMKHFNISGTCRASFTFYNTKDEILKLAKGLETAKNMLS